MNELQGLSWLARKIAWGVSPAWWQEWQDIGVDGIIDRLVDPAEHDVVTRPNPFADLEIDPDRPNRIAGDAVGAWMLQAVGSERPLETFMDFFWSDYFAVSIQSVRPVSLMFDHVGVLARHGLGNFADLLHDVTVDAAMLVFLDGASNAVGRPNENYGRELLELYSVGVGNFDEDDVKAAASALTGWRVVRQNPVPRFVPRRHDDSPQTLLGVDGVHDVDTVIDAIVSNPATADRVVDKLATAILGPGYERDAVLPVVDMFAADLEIRPVVRSLLELGVAGAAQPAIVEPLAWLSAALRFTGATPRAALLRNFFRSSGQIPLLPPNVGGFPEPDAYLSSSATIARFNLGSILAEQATPRAVRVSADIDELAVQLGLVDGFSSTSRDALATLSTGSDRIAAALASPDLLVV